MKQEAMADEFMEGKREGILAALQACADELESVREQWQPTDYFAGAEREVRIITNAIRALLIGIDAP